MFLEYALIFHLYITVERMTGVEPASEAWEASILPMNYIRMLQTKLLYATF